MPNLPEIPEISGPPAPFTLPTVICPACGHGIDPHGLNPGGPCGVGNALRVGCPCMWSPNDIAATLRATESAHLRSQVRRADSYQALLIRADSYLSLLRHRYLPKDTPPDLLREVDALIGELRND